MVAQAFLPVVRHQRAGGVGLNIQKPVPPKFEPLLATKLDDASVSRRSGVADDVKATAARHAAFPVVRFSATGLKLTPELVRAKLIAEYRVVRAGALPEEMG